MVIDDSIEEDMARVEEKVGSPATLAFADNFFGLFRSSSPASAVGKVQMSTSVNLSDPNQRPMDRVILLQQANGRYSCFFFSQVEN
jgi:hypothetical protein